MEARGFLIPVSHRTLYDPAHFPGVIPGDPTPDNRCVRCQDFDSSPAACGVANTDSCQNNGPVVTAIGSSLPSAASLVQTGAGITCD